ncbi:MAG: sulfotransferase [Candidatus Marinimicrobia bacterium]|nr:sulfotransferase [Candidatus Neomarinimicrobiota bacterium]
MNNRLKKIINPLIINWGQKIEKRKFSDKPIIIGACPRSGTTLLLSILDAHPNIYAIQHQSYGFTNWDIDSVSKKIKMKRKDRLYREFILHNIPGNPTRYCEKTPRNIEHFDEILKYFGENAKLIHVIRDGRDVVTSKHPKIRKNQYYVPVQRWIDDVKSGLKFSNRPNVYIIKYENIIYNFKSEIQNLCEFLGEDFSSEIRDWYKNTSVKKSKHWKSPIKAIHNKAIEKWRHAEHKEKLDEFMDNPEAVELLKKLNYIE